MQQFFMPMRYDHYEERKKMKGGKGCALSLLQNRGTWFITHQQAAVSICTLTKLQRICSQIIMTVSIGCYMGRSGVPEVFWNRLFV